MSKSKKTTVAVASKSPLLTAAQIEKDCPALVEDLGNRIAAHYDKLVKCEEKAEQHKIAIGQLLVKAKEACDAGGFTAFRERFCPNLGKSRAHELLLIASGKKTIEETKSAIRERVKKHRAVKKAAAAKKPEPSVTVTDEDPAISAAKRMAAYAAAEAPEVALGAAYAVASETKAGEEGAAPTGAEPTIEDAEAQVEQLKALKAKLKNIGETDKVDVQVSTKALAEFKAACGKWLPNMNSDDLQAGIDYFAEAVEVPAEELIPDLKAAQFDVKIAKAEVPALKRKLVGNLPPHESRSKAWARLAGQAAENVEALIEYQQEFQDVKDGQPENLQNGPLTQKCDVICDIDLRSALETLEEAANAEVPLGFGRD